MTYDSPLDDLAFGLPKRRVNMNPAANSTEANQKNTCQRRRISIVDYDASVRRSLNRLLQSFGYIVNVYESAEAFLATEVADDPDLLVLDVHLPGRSGLQLQLELQNSNKRLPVIFITAFDDEQTRTKAIERGAIAFLGKPLDSERLLDLVRRTLDDNRDR